MENQSTLPRHAGLITDGNRRWAKEHNLPSFEGHNKGFDAIKKIIETAGEKGIGMFTFWAFFHGKLEPLKRRSGLSDGPFREIIKRL
jgi:Undecaprenyl pyrophosphate synthase